MNAPNRAAGAVIFRRSEHGIRLLVLRAYKNWDFPKGMVEPGEDALAAARREVHEETGLTDLDYPFGEEFRGDGSLCGGQDRALLPGAGLRGENRASGFARARPPGAPRVPLGELRRSRRPAAPSPRPPFWIGQEKPSLVKETSWTN
jgi:8-oxo-dGTP pyrophosphatase MutT (NUDIX family)